VSIPYRTATVAEAFGVTTRAVRYWASQWHPTGKGGRLRLTDTDVMLLQAIFTITDRTRGGGECQRRLIECAEAAIRGAPRRWLLLAGPVVETCDSAEDAAAMWLNSRHPAGQVIDLWRPWEAA